MDTVPDVQTERSAERTTGELQCCPHASVQVRLNGTIEMKS